MAHEAADAGMAMPCRSRHRKHDELPAAGSSRGYRSLRSSGKRGLRRRKQPHSGHSRSREGSRRFGTCRHRFVLDLGIAATTLAAQPLASRNFYLRRRARVADLLRYKTQALIRFVRRLFRVVHLSSLEEKVDGLLTSFVDGLRAVTTAQQLQSCRGGRGICRHGHSLLFLWQAEFREYQTGCC